MWPREAVTLLIDKYREHANLYDVKHPLYLDRVKRSISLLALSKEVKKIVPHVTADDVKKKIHILRTQYGSELRNMANFKENASNAEQEYEPKLWFFSQLEYLKPLYPTKRLEGSVSRASSNNKPKPQPKEKKIAVKKEVKHTNAVFDAFEECGNDLSVLAEGWSSQYAELSREQKVFARKMISDILFHGCLEDLTQNTVTKIHNFFESSSGKGGGR